MTNETILNLKHHLYTELKTTLPKERRIQLIEEMKELSDQKIHCYNCTGTCCTMNANSMQVTPLEAFEMVLSLDINESNLEEIKKLLNENIQHYRLDHEIFLGKKAHTNLRKTYTCPFFIPGPKGCTIKKELKPYGCLGFNPKLENDNGTNCHSNQTLLGIRESKNSECELKANEYLKKEFQIYWSKMEIPKAILFLLEKITF